MPKSTRKPETEEAKALREARKAALEAAAENFELDEDDAAMMRAFNALTEHYSEGNSLLILAQCVDQGLKVRGPQDVAAFRTWLDRGRAVRKGEHQTIFIWQPCGTSSAEKTTEETQEKPGEDGKTTVRRYFRVAGLFHKSQTDKLPETKVAS